MEGRWRVICGSLAGIWWAAAGYLHEHSGASQVTGHIYSVSMVHLPHTHPSQICNTAHVKGSKCQHISHPYLHYIIIYKRLRHSLEGCLRMY